jgi:hypothetical protein
MKVRPRIAQLQPDWVCRDCGEKWGRWWDGPVYSGPSCHCATFHENACGVCGETKAVTEARDYGYLRDGWRLEVSG